MCYRVTSTLHRYRTAWRELLHPLPVKARKIQWLKRDKTEMNEALLRQPYYTIKTYNLPSYVNKAVMFGNIGAVSPDGYAGIGMNDHVSDLYGMQRPTYGMEMQLKAARHATSPERLQQLREQLQLPVRTGPEIPRMVKRRRATSASLTANNNNHDKSVVNDSSNVIVENNEGYEVAPSFTDEYGARLRPRYPESWDTVPQHQPSRAPM